MIPIGVNIHLSNLTSGTQTDMGYDGASVKRMKILIKVFTDSNNNKAIEGENFLKLVQACPNLEVLDIRIFMFVLCRRLKMTTTRIVQMVVGRSSI